MERSSYGERVQRVSRVDVAVATAVAFPTVMDAWWNAPGTRQADALTYAIAAVSIGALLVRRSWPVAVSVVCGAALTAWYLLGHHGQLLNLPTMVALYTVATAGDRRRSVVAAAVGAAWAATVSIAADSPSGTPLAEAAWPVLALLLGEVVRSRRELLASYADRAARAEADREAEARRQVQDERVRIARELHDIVAHTVAAMNVQAGVAADALDSRPDLARRALNQVRASGREALDELHATVGLLRDDGRAPVTPVPRLDDLDLMAARASSPDLTVTVERDMAVDRSGSGDLPPMVEVAAYRIAQEAVTNVIRHARARHARVAVHRGGSELVVEVTDDGRGPASGTNGDDRGDRDDGSADAVRSGHGHGDVGHARQGFGLTGMRERAAAVGGTIEHGPRPGGGFRVRAVLPVPPTTRRHSGTPAGDMPGADAPGGDDDRLVP
jgi:signal transduction histidine kinase